MITYGLLGITHGFDRVKIDILIIIPSILLLRGGNLKNQTAVSYL